MANRLLAAALAILAITSVGYAADAPEHPATTQPGDRSTGSLGTAAAAAGPAGTADPSTPRGAKAIDQRLSEPMGPIHLDHMPAKKAFAWWSATTSIDLNMNWNTISDDGLDPETPITLDYVQLSGERTLRKLMDQLSPDKKMIAVRTPWYVEVMTKAEANRHPVVRLYDIGDLLPNIAATVAVGQAASSGTGSFSSGRSSSGAGGAGGSGFGNAEANGEKIAQLIRTMVEPDVWVENGGTATISYYHGNLLVRAPLYVQVKIGQPTASLPEEGDPPPSHVRP